MSETTPFELLSTIREEAQVLASKGLTYATLSTGVKNIAFRVNGINFYCHASEIKEVSVCENLMVVPQTKGWMRGLVNSKGVLYSVSDVSLFAGYGRPVQTNKGHLLLLNDENQQAALLVNRVIGFRYFEGSQTALDIESKQEVLDGLSVFVEEGFHTDEQDWYRLNVEKLLESEQFREVQ